MTPWTIRKSPKMTVNKSLNTSVITIGMINSRASLLTERKDVLERPALLVISLFPTTRTQETPHVIITAKRAIARTKAIIGRMSVTPHTTPFFLISRKYGFLEEYSAVISIAESGTVKSHSQIELSALCFL